jgi:hypothetical protein
MAVRLSAIRAGGPIPPGKILSRLRAHSAAGMIRSIEKSNNLIGNRTHDLPASTIVLQSITLLRAVRVYSLPRECVYRAVAKQR